MKKKLFAVHDAKIGLYAEPFFLLTTADAVRGWITVSNDQNTQIGKYPEDFTLFELGEYDDETGVVANHQVPLSLGLALNYRKPVDTSFPFGKNQQPTDTASKGMQ